MTPATAAALRCPVCGGPLLLTGRSLRCARAHSFDLAKEGYAYLLPMQKKHAADPGDGKARRCWKTAPRCSGWSRPWRSWPGASTCGSSMFIF